MEVPGEISPVVTIAAAGAAIILLAGTCLRSARVRRDEARRDYASCLRNESDAGEIVRILSRRGFAEAFVAGLVSLEGRLLRILGAPWSWRLFNNALLAGIVAPVALFSLAWLTGARGEFAGVQAFPEIAAVSERAWRLLVVVVFAGAMLFLGSRLGQGAGLVRRVMTELRGHAGTSRENGLTAPVAVMVRLLLAQLLAALVVLAIVVAFAASRSLALGPAFALAFSATLAFAFRERLALAWAAACVVAGLWIVAGAAANTVTEPSLLLGFWFAAAAPLALAFYFAWSMTISIIGTMVNRLGGKVSAALTVAATLGLLGHAAGSAVIFAIGEGFSFQWLNSFLLANHVAPLAWRGVIAATIESSAVSPQAWLTIGMGICVALPAALVLTYGASSLILARLPDRARALAMLQNGGPLSPEQQAGVVERLARLDMFRPPARAFVFLLLVGLTSVAGGRTAPWAGAGLAALSETGAAVAK